MDTYFKLPQKYTHWQVTISSIRDRTVLTWSQFNTTVYSHVYFTVELLTYGKYVLQKLFYTTMEVIMGIEKYN